MRHVTARGEAHARRWFAVQRVVRARTHRAMSKSSSSRAHEGDENASRGRSRASCSRARLDQRRVHAPPTPRWQRSRTARGGARDAVPAPGRRACSRATSTSGPTTSNRCSPRAGSPPRRPARRSRRHAPRRRIDWIAVDAGLARASAPGCTSRSWATTARSVADLAVVRARSLSREPIVSAVPYATRPMHDADSHIMEEPDWLHPYLDAATRERFPYVWSVGDEPGPAGDRRRSAPVTPTRSTAPRTSRSSCCARTSPRPVRS